MLIGIREKGGRSELIEELMSHVAEGRHEAVGLSEQTSGKLGEMVV